MSPLLLTLEMPRPLCFQILCIGKFLFIETNKDIGTIEKISDTYTYRAPHYISKGREKKYCMYFVYIPPHQVKASGSIQ